ncbi:MAG: hypothetical protein AB8B72_01485 [Crocinitomicaceae bacterium]
MKYLITILLFVLVSGCAEKSQKKIGKVQELSELSFYVDDLDPIDTLCISEVERAKKDLKKGKTVFSHRAGLGFGNIRYEDELRALCRQIGLEFEIEPVGCVIYEGQTQGCYGEYMNKILLEKNGADFKDKIYEMADDLFIQNIINNNITVAYWDCDERPRLPNESKRTSDHLPSLYQSEIDVKDDGSNYGGYPFFDLGFVVEKDSTISNFHSRSYVAGNDANEKYKDKLYLLAKKHVMTNYPIWVPGELNGKQVRTNNNVRLFIVKK